MLLKAGVCCACSLGHIMNDDTRLYEAALLARQTSGANGTSSARCSFIAEPAASKEPGVDERMIGGFASKVKKAADGFERHWPMAARGCRELLAGRGRRRPKVPGSVGAASLPRPL